MKIRKLLSALLAIMMTASLLVTAVQAEEEEDDEDVVFAPREYETYHGEIPNLWDDAWHAVGYTLEEYIKLDGEKDKVYDYGLILETKNLIEGEDSGASAKIYLLNDARLRVFIEVTDPELVRPTDEQQFGDPKGVEAFDSISLLLDPEEEQRGPYLPNPETGEYEQVLQEGSIARLYRFDWTGAGFGYWTDYVHSKEYDPENKADGRYLTNCDLAGFGDALHGVIGPVDTKDPNSGLIVKETETGYNIETNLFLTKSDEDAVFGLEVILNDAYDGGEKVASYSTNAALNKENVLDYTLWNGVTLASSMESLLVTNADVLALYDPNAQTDTQPADDSSEPAASGGESDTSKPADTSKPDGGKDEDNGNIGVVIICVIAAVLLAVVIAVVLYKKKNQNPSAKEKSGADTASTKTETPEEKKDEQTSEEKQDGDQH